MIGRLLTGWKVRTGLVLFGVFALLALIGPWLLGHLGGYDPRAIDYAHLRSAPDGSHLLGTTNDGEDVFAQLVAGARGSVGVGVLSGLIAVVLAVVVGVTGGFLGGRTDQVLSVVTNLFITMPAFALILVVAGYLEGASWVTIALLIGIFEWPGGARYLRAQTLSLRNRDFALAAAMIGENRRRLIFAEVLPHLVGIISTLFLRAVIAGIFAEAGLDFLGIGNTDTISWGTMIATAQNQSAILRGYWWWYVPPGLCIALIGTATALVNFGVDEITNPKLRAARRGTVKAARRLALRREAAA